MLPIQPGRKGLLGIRSNKSSRANTPASSAPAASSCLTVSWNQPYLQVFPLPQKSKAVLANFPANPNAEPAQDTPRGERAGLTFGSNCWASKSQARLSISCPFLDQGKQQFLYFCLGSDDVFKGCAWEELNQASNGKPELPR